MFNLRRGEKGFTLVEIMVVLVILGVLATISVPVYTGYVRKARISEAISNVGAYANAMRIYKMEHAEYPPSTQTLNVSIDEYYFGITWVLSFDKLTATMTITPKTTSDIPVADTGTYILDKDYKGAWSGVLVEKYASYLKRS